MKKMDAVIAMGCVLLLGTVCPAAAPKTVRVETVAQLVATIDSKVVIELEPGDYDLREVWKVPRKNTKKVRMDKVHDGHELVLSGIVGLTIRGIGKKRSRIITPSSYATVLTLNNCDRITLENLAFGHWPEPGWCAGRVMRIFRTREVQMTNCDLFGSGTIGIDIERSTGVGVRRSTLRDCSDWLVRAFYSKKLTFDRMQFRENKKRDADRAFHFHEAYEIRVLHSTLTTIAPQTRTIEKIIGKGLPEEYVLVKDCSLVMP